MCWQYMYHSIIPYVFSISYWLLFITLHVVSLHTRGVYWQIQTDWARHQGGRGRGTFTLPGMGGIYPASLHFIWNSSHFTSLPYIRLGKVVPLLLIWFQRRLYWHWISNQSYKIDKSYIDISKRKSELHNRPHPTKVYISQMRSVPQIGRDT